MTTIPMDMINIRLWLQLVLLNTIPYETKRIFINFCACILDKNLMLMLLYKISMNELKRHELLNSQGQIKQSAMNSTKLYMEKKALIAAKNHIKKPIKKEHYFFEL